MQKRTTLPLFRGFGFLALGIIFTLAFSSTSSLHADGPPPSTSFDATVVSDNLGLGETATYTITFNAPQDLSAGVGQQPGDMLNINVFPNGPSDANRMANLTNLTVGAGSTIAGSFIREMPQQDPGGGQPLDSNSTLFQVTSSVSQGQSVVLKMAGVVNPGIQGQQTISISLGGQTMYQASVAMVVGAGQTFAVSGTVSKAGVGVSSAQISASQRSGSMFLNTNVAADGTYSINLPIGTWELRVGPQWGNDGQQVAVDWAYNGFGEAVAVSDAPVSGINFTVVSATAVVTGKVLLPNGSPLTNGGIDIRSGEGVGVGSGINPQTGVFSVQVPAGTYRLGVFSQDPSYAAPALAPFSVAENSTKDLGTITLVAKTSHIKGVVTVKGTATGVVGMNVNTWSPSGWSETTTAADGSFDLLVGPGEWEVMLRARPGSGYAVEGGPPTRVTIADAQTVTGQNFQVLLANASIDGRIVDAQGTLISNFFGFAQAMEGNGDPPKPGPGTSAEGGVFSLQVPAGTWAVDVHTEPGSEYSSTGAQSVTIGENENKNVTITLQQNDALITGTVRDDEGNAVTGVRTEVFAENGRGSFKMAFVNEATGTYSMGVVGGTSWYLGVFVEPGNGLTMIPPSDSKTTVASGQSVVKDFALLRANATISGTVLDPSGNGLGNVFVFADTHLGEDGAVLGAQTTIGGPLPENSGGPGGDLKQGLHTGDLTRGDGTFTLAVPAGTYGIGSGAPSSLGYINPEFISVSVAKGEEKTGYVLSYRQSDAQITGTITLDGVQSEGFVWAWSDSGSHSETYSRTGSYTLNVTSGDVWHIGADFGNGQDFYQSPEYMVSMVGATTATRALVLTKSIFTMPPSTSQQIEAASGGTIQMEDGFTVVIPAGAFGSSGTYTVTISPTAQLTKEKSRRPVAFGYSVSAVDSSGQAFTSTFNSNVRFIIPYTDAMLTALGINSTDVSASFFDTTSGIWQGVESFTVNTEDKTIIATVSHFTEFALTTGSADTTAPSVPTSLTATAGVGKVTLAWTNPTDADFDHVVIYRSTTSGSQGESLTTSTGTSYEDTGLAAGTIYYYTLVSVDAVGNSSDPTSQVSAAPTATPIPALELPMTGTSVMDAALFYVVRGLIAILGLSGVFFFARRKFRVGV